MVEKYSQNVSREVAREYLEGIERIKDIEYRKIIESALLKAAADHLNDIGYQYSSIEAGDGEIIQIRSEVDSDGGDTLTLDGLRDIADI
jgi:hypothetical protein